MLFSFPPSNSTLSHFLSVCITFILFEILRKHSVVHFTTHVYVSPLFGVAFSNSHLSFCTGKLHENSQTLQEIACVKNGQTFAGKRAGFKNSKRMLNIGRGLKIAKWYRALTSRF